MMALRLRASAGTFVRAGFDVPHVIVATLAALTSLPIYRLCFSLSLALGTLEVILLRVLFVAHDLPFLDEVRLSTARACLYAARTP